MNHALSLRQSNHNNAKRLFGFLMAIFSSSRATTTDGLHGPIKLVIVICTFVKKVYCIRQLKRPRLLEKKP